MLVAIIGGGASGLFAAAVISKYASVTVFERNEKAGKKIYITGKGRCNFTNLCLPNEFLASVVRGSKFLISAINSFPPEKAIDFFSEHGMKSVVERGNRVFPQSNKASDVTATLVKTISANGGKILYDTRVQKIIACDGGFTITANGEEFKFDKVILATGGVSYQSTGSTGDGYKFASEFGHAIIEPRPALSPIILKEDVSSIEGLSLKNVCVKVISGKKEYSEFGEMLFTHSGVSGPCVLTLSSLINRLDGQKQLVIDLKPAITKEELDKRILRDFEANINRDYKNSLRDLLPKSLIPYIIARSKINPDKKVNLITKEERLVLVDLLKNLTFTIDSLDKIDYAIVTSGGVDVKEVSPKTMESKLVPNLYIIGELLDVDAFTGGFNLQIAWATAYAAARHIGDF
ncbi:MAG: NAD(P)/FAD-dependent oxidoreductase [Clostridiales bacterium]|nr:NAD(P)/FAD-dependent oxidoreductase [Clostridiales bacterium]